MRNEGWRLEINLVELSGSGRSPRDPPTPCAHMGPFRADLMAKMATSARPRKECVVVRKTVHFVSIMLCVRAKKPIIKFKFTGGSPPD